MTRGRIPQERPAPVTLDLVAPLPPMSNEVIEIPETNEVDMTALSPLACRVCFVDQIPPLYACLNGHAICMACHSALKTTPKQFPSCRVDLTQLARGLQAEDIVARFLPHLKVACPHADCSDRCTIAEMPKHRENCPHRPVECIYPPCTWKGAKQTMYMHLMEKHKTVLSVPTSEIRDGSLVFLLKWSGSNPLKEGEDEHRWLLPLSGLADHLSGHLLVDGSVFIQQYPTSRYFNFDHCLMVQGNERNRGVSVNAIVRDGNFTIHMSSVIRLGSAMSLSIPCMKPSRLTTLAVRIQARDIDVSTKKHPQDDTDPSQEPPQKKQKLLADGNEKD